MKNTKTMTFYSKALFGIVLTLVLSLLMFLIVDKSFLYKASVLDLPQHASFDGTVYPIKKVPNWVELDSSDWDKTYNQLRSSSLVNTPYYDPNKLKIPVENLKWGDTDDDKIRVMKITYSVPYMGNYLLDGRENAGSHLAVDIKIPNGTPVYAIANGTVSKVSNQSSGFGHHIVIQHNNFPTLTNPNARETLHSSYSHLGNIEVEVGDVVRKGDLIAYSGETGTATTPHLHFQLDNDDAPWHPYWPFTSSEAYSAGLDFFSAVNAGLGKDSALRTTINPMKFVQEYMDDDFAPQDDNEDEEEEEEEEEEVDEEEVDDDDDNDAESLVDDTDNDSEDSEEEEVEGDDDSDEQPEQEEEEDEEEEEPLDPPVLTFEIEVADEYYVGSSSNFKVSLRDQYGNEYKDGFMDSIVISSKNGNITADGAIVTPLQFQNGQYEGAFKRMEAGKDKLKIEYNDETFYSEWFEILDDLPEISFLDLQDSNKYYDPVMVLAEKGIINGYPDGSFRPYNSVNRVEALKLIFEAVGKKLSLGRLPFKDVDENAWYSKYLYTAYKKEVVNGHPDGTFKPSDTVNKAEFFKMLLNTYRIDVDDDVKQDPYTDVPKNAWFAPYIAKAKELGLIDEGTTALKPETGMSRGDVATAIYRLIESEEV